MLDEQFGAQLVTALHRAGRTAAAIEQYHALRNRLVDQLGIDPSPAVQARYRELLHQEAQPSAAPPAPDGRERGSARPAQLPADVTGFTGRRAAVAELDRLLRAATGSTAVVIAVLTGTAGVGKTALAVHWAHRVRGDFPDGQLYVNLRGYAPAPPVRPLEALARLLRALGVPAERVPTDLDEAAALYRSLLADRRMLVLLDNTRSAEQVRPLLPGSPGCLAVVTSRDALTGLVAQDGAHPLDLDVLDDADATALLTRLLGSDRVEREPEATAELAAACVRLPLALRIAAANLVGRAATGDLVASPGRGPALIAGYVTELAGRNRLTVLRAKGDPQVAVQAAIDLSYARLPRSARRQYRLLGLVPGPDLTVDVAAALTGTPVREARRLLGLLAEAHLVQWQSPDRYTFHDLLRLHAAERTRHEDAEPDRLAALDRLYDYYLRGADAAAGTLHPHLLRLPSPPAIAAPGPPATAAGHAEALPLAAGETGQAGGFADHMHASAWLEAERSNLVAAVVAAVDQGRPRLAWSLADALRGYLYFRSHVVDWLTVGQAVLVAAEAAGDDHAIAAAHLSLANLHGAQSRHGRAVDHFVRALAASRRAGWVECQASVLGNLGAVYRQSGRLRQASTYYRQALALNRRVGRLGGQATNLANLGAVYYELGRLEQAFEHNRQALALYRKIRSRSGEASALTDLGELHHLLGRVGPALEHLACSLELQREVGSRANEAEATRCLAAVHRDTGRLAEAADLAGRALALAQATGERRFERMALNTAGTIELERGRPDAAVEHHQRALALARADGHRYCEADALVGLSAALARLGRPDQALDKAAQAAEIAVQGGFRLIEGHARTRLAAVHLDRDDPEAAADDALRAVALLEETGHRLGMARALLVAADTVRRGGQAETADRLRSDAGAIFAEIGSG